MTASFGDLLAAFGRLVLERMAEESEEIVAVEPRRRLLPLTAALLNGRRALEAGAYGVAVQQFASVGLHLALIACTEGEAELRLLDFAGLQRRRHDLHHGREPAWHETDRRQCFDRALANAVSVAYEIDGCGARRRRIAQQAADCANYLLYFLALSGVSLEEERATGGEAA